MPASRLRSAMLEWTSSHSQSLALKGYEELVLRSAAEPARDFNFPDFMEVINERGVATGMYLAAANKMTSDEEQVHKELLKIQLSCVCYCFEVVCAEPFVAGSKALARLQDCITTINVHGPPDVSKHLTDDLAAATVLIQACKYMNGDETVQTAEVSSEKLSSVMSTINVKTLPLWKVLNCSPGGHSLVGFGKALQVQYDADKLLEQEFLTCHQNALGMAPVTTEEFSKNGDIVFPFSAAYLI